MGNEAESKPTLRPESQKPQGLPPENRQGRLNYLRNLLTRFRKTSEKPPAETETANIPDYLNNTLWHTSREVKRANPKIGSTIDTVLQEVEKQTTIENITTYESKIFPGTVFTVSKLIVTPESVTTIARENPDAILANPPAVKNPTVPQNDITVDFGYFLLPPQGHALDVIDMAIDRFIRKIPKVAHAMRSGQTPPNVEIYLLGSTTGFGGKLSSEFTHAVAKDGFDAIGKVYGEFINDVVLKGKSPENTHLMLQGGSMGAPTADHTLPYVDKDFAKNTQLLLDVPAGHHKPGIIKTPLKGAQTAAGLFAETGYRMARDERTKDPAGRGKRLYEYLKTEKGIKDDDPYLRRLKTMLWDTGTKLVKGVPLSYERGTYIRNATRDPLTTGPKRRKLVEKDLGKPIVTHSMKRREEHPEDYIGKEPYPIEKAKVNVSFWQTGHALETAVDSTHFWFYARDFDRWQQNIEYCKAPPPKQPGQEKTPQAPTQP